MNRKQYKGWIKHGDFVFLDIICVYLSYLCAFVIRHGFINPYDSSLYRNISIIVVLLDIVVIFFFEPFKNIMRRGYYKEFVAIFKQDLMIMLLVVLYLFSNKEAQYFSRTVLYLTGGIYLILSYVIRIIWKEVLKIPRFRNFIQGEEKRALLIFADKRNAQEFVTHISGRKYKIDGLVIVDEDMLGEFIGNIPVVANMNTALSYVCREWVDEILFLLSSDSFYPEKLVEQFIETGITIHINYQKISSGSKQIMGEMFGYNVISTSTNFTSVNQLFIKRLIDILGGIIGCIFTGIIFVFIAPVIYVYSPGPIFFSQVRMGKNGKKFKMYKFRSMYMDAEERKKDLMSQNKVRDGMMFKLDFDPRVIGNKILSDGRKKTGIGNFIRITSLDEFPQFFNVLKGDMSLVGTRPPTVDEWEKYEVRHRARLSIKPGITGMWQVNGRSEVTDFEEVVKLDKKYINEWSIGLDIKILLMTVLTVIRRNGAR